MQIDTTLAMVPMTQVGKLARRAEQMGFSGVFTAGALQTPSPAAPPEIALCEL